MQPLEKINAKETLFVKKKLKNLNARLVVLISLKNYMPLVNRKEKK